MNPLTNVRNIGKLNDQDLQNGIFDHNLTWHSQYKDSAFIFIGGLPYDLTEGDVLAVFSQYGEIVNINLVRDKKTGKFKGYGFLCYEDQRSTILAVDNFNGIKLGGRTIRVDHVGEYRPPKGDEKDESGKYKDKVEVSCAPRTPSPKNDLVDEKKSKKKKKKKEKKSKKDKIIKTKHERKDSLQKYKEGEQKEEKKRFEKSSELITSSKNQSFEGKDCYRHHKSISSRSRSRSRDRSRHSARNLRSRSRS
ncbi:RNA-binding motif protein, X-linked 2 isoform X2 [Hydra vulgaris]|uniref:RNA-binding motif protein, X-linked 2 isoform X2 n=1 Tax=Hydra vulgaris TaxID=6087 RepID=A0ABM4B5R7_HYDVU